MNPNSFVPEEYCGKPAIDDRGQRYEVRYFHVETGAEHVMGWTERSDGGALMSSVKLWPRARDPFIVDRGIDADMRRRGYKPNPAPPSTGLCCDSPDGNHHWAPIGSEEEWTPSKACWYCGYKQAFTGEAEGDGGGE